MADNEAVLLKRFSTKADAEAFAELVQRYARLVYSTSWRILKHESDAADVTQQTFFELTRHASRISGSLSGWLHRVATQKSIDVIRRSAHRRHREQVYTQDRSVETRTWQDLSGHVDEVLDTLDAPVKALLLERFLAGKTTVQIAREQGLSQATVSRRINEGLSQLRGRLRRQGLLVAGAALGTMLMESSSQAVPTAVQAELSKMAMVGTTSAGTALGGGAVATAKATVVKAVLVAAIGVGLVTTAGTIYSLRSSRASQPRSAPMQTDGQAPPQEQGGPARPAEGMVMGFVSVPSGSTRAPLSPSAGGQTSMEPSAAGIVPAPGTGEAAIAPATKSAGQAPAAGGNTAEAVMRNFLAGLGDGAGDRLAQYLADGAEGTVDRSCLRCLAGPVAVLNIVADSNDAEVLWSAAACEELHLDGQTRSAGESVTLVARLKRIDGLWKISSISLAPAENSAQ